MSDNYQGSSTYNPEGANFQPPNSRNFRQFNNTGPRRQRWVQQPTDDYFYQNSYSRGPPEQCYPNQVSQQYQPYSGADHVNNYRNKRSGRGQSTRYRGNSSWQNRDRQYNNGSESSADEFSSPNTYTASNQQFSASATHCNIETEGDVKLNSSEEMPQVVEQMTEAREQRGLVVGGRYLRKNTNLPQRTEYQSPGSTDGQQHYGNKSYETDLHERNQSYGGSRRNGNQNNSYFERGNNVRCKQKFGFRTRGGKQNQMPDMNENTLSPSPEVGFRNSDMQNGDSKARSESLYKSSSQQFRTSGNTKLHVPDKHQCMSKSHVDEDEATQRDRLIVQLNKGECECMVCCESIRSRDQVWSCTSCYHIFHLRCIRKWARSPAAVVEDSGWRCPACQNITCKVPFIYFCFCGKSKDPETSHHLTPHSCGQVCGKERPSELCPHRCNILCHPGPCPPCSATITRQCGCGKIKKTVPCRQQSSLCCGSVCDKLLNCGVHHCESLCHSGDCEPCSKIQNQICFCGKVERQVPCTEETSTCTQFVCDDICKKKLACGHHYCEDKCHPGPCAPCSLLPSSVDKCPCGKTPVKWLYDKDATLIRKTCLDPVPVCKALCDQILQCGPKENPHICTSQCHLGECPPCPLTTVVKCRCGAVTKEFSCVEYISQSTFLCEKRCTRRKDCGRHKCLSLCCIGLNHVCELVCNKKLSCGNHQCAEKCHMGNCPPCRNVSFDELTCYCGASILYPPIHCGTKPPECSEPCTRSQTCKHPVQHNCHCEDTCPPCTVLTVKWCFGKHMQRKNVQCFLEGISCGHPCDKPLPCNVHKCQEICHEGPCLKNNSRCVQLCTKPRPDCEHPCGTPCHKGPCPDVPCRAKMNVSCPCGNRTEVVICSESSKAYHLVSMSMLASKMQDIKLGQSVNMSDVLGKKNKTNRLQCNEECAVLERNKRLAVALQIQNPDLSCKPGAPNYSEFLKDEARKSPQFIMSIYDKLAELVHLAKESKKKSRSHAFPPMNRDQRRVIHELAEFFGCESQSYDEEPKKSVTVTAFREKSWLPFVGIMAVVQREMGQRKGPTPIISKATTSAIQSATQPKERTIDYFDFKEDS